jgi:hypothetical protein
MQSIISKLRYLEDDQLLIVSEAIDIEIARREELMEEHPDSAKTRARQRGRGHSYRSNLGTKAPPVRVVGMKDSGRRRRDAA